MGEQQKEGETMKNALFLAAFLTLACEPLDVKSVQSDEACEFQHAVPVPYQGCNRITGEFRVARYDLDTQQCLLSELTYSCVGTFEELYVVGVHKVEETDALVANSCAVCNGYYYEALPSGEAK